MANERVAMVFAHPGHEIAVAGLIQRWQPHILYLTAADGDGQADRPQLAGECLARLGAESRATYLNFSEARSYDWILHEDFTPVFAA